MQIGSIHFQGALLANAAMHTWHESVCEWPFEANNATASSWMLLDSRPARGAHGPIHVRSGARASVLKPNALWELLQKGPKS